MKIVPIFAEQENAHHCNLWSVCFPEHRVDGHDIDIFSKLFDLWNDTNYLQSFFIQHADDLLNPFWKGMSINDAIDKVIDEALDFIEELESVENQKPGYEGKTVKEIFHSLHKEEFILKGKDENFKKAKPNFTSPMLRLYGFQLEDGTIVITGGAIKLTDQMQGDHLKKEIAQIQRVKDFLSAEFIYNKEGLNYE